MSELDAFMRRIKKADEFTELSSPWGHTIKMSSM